MLRCFWFEFILKSRKYHLQEKNVLLTLFNYLKVFIIVLLFSYPSTAPLFLPLLITIQKVYVKKIVFFLKIKHGYACDTDNIQRIYPETSIQATILSNQ